MTTRTKSEGMFEAWCRAHAIVCRRVTEAASPRPDYELKLAGEQVLAEIKQLDPNADERTTLARQALGEQAVFGSKPGERLRRVISSANTQLRELLAGRPIATLLVVYNNTPVSLHTEPYAVMTAMQGLDVVDVEVPADANERPRFRKARSGPGRVMRPDANTSTSAVAVLSEPDPDEFHLAVYHNRYAAAPLAPRLLALPGVIQARLPEGARNSVEAKWELVLSTDS